MFYTIRETEKRKNDSMFGRCNKTATYQGFFFLTVDLQ